MENARLFNETQEALEQQKASADVLGAISKSVADTAPVFEAILGACQRLFGSDEIGIYTIGDDDMVRVAAWRGPRAEEVRHDVTPVHESITGRIIRERRTHHIPDLGAVPNLSPTLRDRVDRLGGASLLYAPMLWEDRGLGSILVARSPPKPFSDRERALLQSFADQAAIAIQNARLFNETQEALEHQKASGEVLRAIAQSVADATPVFENILSASQRLFGTEEVCIFTVGDDGMVRPAAVRGPTFSAARNDVMPLEGSRTGRAIRERRVHHIPDGLGEPGTPPAILERMRRSGNVSIAFAPMLWEDSGLGSIAILRSPPRPFSERELDLLRGFADQAAIAIQNARMFRETNEALEQQRASADILGVISKSVADAQPVFEKILESCKQLFDGDELDVLLIDDEGLLQVAAYLGKARDAILATFPAPWEATPAGRAIRERRVANYSDVLNNPDAPPVLRRVGKIVGYHSVAFAPMIWEDRGIGAVGVARSRGAFTEKEMALLQTFADQAVIAIQNARMFEEVQAKTRDLTEALQQQTATAEVLKVISRSAFDLDAVLGTLVESARTLCDAPQGMILLRDGPVLRMAKQKGYPEAFERWVLDNPQPPSPYSGAGRAALTGEVAHFPDVLEDPDYRLSDGQRLGGYRALLSVPLLREQEVLGVFSLGRPTPGPFNERQVELVRTFADQAVIAIENVRLFDEVQARTRDLSEALQQQTATAEVLKVISRSAFDLDAVLNSLTKSAVELCNSTYGAISLYRDGVLKFMAQTGCTPEFAELLWSHPAQLDRKSVTGRTGLLRTVVLVPDVTQDEDYDYHGGEVIGNYRSCMGVPLLRNGELEGVFTLMRQEPGLFTQRQVELVQTFADQAVIAIENVRLFNEVQARTRDLTEALQLQTATSDVLKVISRSAFDLQGVFGTLISSAVELCGADGGTICVRDGEVFRFRANAGASQTEALTKYLEEHPATPGPGSTAGRVLLSGKVEAIPDCLEDPDYAIPMDSLSQSVRSILGVPLLGKEGIEGALVLTRKEPGHFTPRQVEIVQTFADQAVIAIENVRLFDEVQARTRELAASLDDLRKAQDRLIQSEKLASLGQLTAGIAHEIKNPLNFVNNFSALTRELVDELGETLKRAPLDETQREEADDLVGTIGANLDKVVSHGKRADSIVKNMLLHSREGSGERTSVNVNAMVEEALNLAYHSARAEKAGFNVTIAKSLDDKAGSAELYGQEMTRVLLNLISNGFYATTKRKQGEGNGSYEPTIAASTRDLGDRVEITIRDNGTGIPDEVKAKMFNPFFTTKPAGEGTGLGLSLSHDIVVKQHGGTLDVSTEPGSHTQFTIVLPRAGAGA